MREIVNVNEDGKMVTVKWAGGLNGVAYFHGKDWHRTETDARVRAEDMRLAKIKNLREQIKKLNTMTF